MIPDTPEYFAAIQSIRDALPVQPASKESFFFERPRTELVTITVTRGIFWKREKRIKGIKLLTRMIYWSQDRQEYIIELAGITCDGASVPQIFWSIFPPFGKGEGAEYLFAAIGHDKTCRQGREGIARMNSKDAANLFREMMEAQEVRRSISAVMPRFVKWFGPRFKAA
jgi:hypothetical protein